MTNPIQLTADKTTWYAVESILKFALQQTSMLGDDVMFVQKIQSAVSLAITNAEAGDGCARIH